MTSATDILRRLLDERGVEHYDGESMTYINDADFMPAAGGTFDVTLYERTPEQAVDATLWRGTCHETVIDHYWRGCGSCGYIWEFMYGIGKCERPCYCPNCGRKVVK